MKNHFRIKNQLLRITAVCCLFLIPFFSSAQSQFSIEVIPSFNVSSLSNSRSSAVFQFHTNVNWAYTIKPKIEWYNSLGFVQFNSKNVETNNTHWECYDYISKYKSNNASLMTGLIYSPSKISIYGQFGYYKKLGDSVSKDIIENTYNLKEEMPVIDGTIFRSVKNPLRQVYRFGVGIKQKIFNKEGFFIGINFLGAGNHRSLGANLKYDF